MPTEEMTELRRSLRGPQPKKRDELTLEDIRDLANRLTTEISKRVEIDMADEEAIYDDMKMLLAKYLVD